MASIQAARTAGFSWDAYARSCADAKIEGLEEGGREGGSGARDRWRGSGNGEASVEWQEI